MESKKICAICLWTDVNLRTIPSTLMVYHDELTDYSLTLKNPRYCSICECLLRKTYTFHRNVAESAKILNKWMKTTTKDKISVHQLHRKVPLIMNLKRWMPEENRALKFTSVADLEYTEVNVMLGNSVSEKADTFKELNISENLNSDAIKDEGIGRAIHSEEVLKMEFKNECYQVTEVSDSYFRIFSNGSENVDDNKQLQENANNRKYNTFTSTGIAGEINNEDNKIDGSQKEVMNMTKEPNYTTGTGIVRENKIQTPYIMLDIDDIKNYVNKTVHHLSKPTHDEVTVDDGILKLNENMLMARSASDNKSIIKSENWDLELVCLNGGDNKDDEMTVIDAENGSVDDASLNSGDDCDDYLYQLPKKRRLKRKTLDTDIALESNVNKTKNRCFKNDYSIDKLILTERSITSKLESINKTLDLICENWEITSLTDVADNIPRDELKKVTHKYLTERKLLHPERLEYVKKIGVFSKIGHLSSDLDLINDRCVNTVEDYKIGLYSPLERLKEKLKMWEHWTLHDGFVLNKDKIMNSLDMVPDQLIQKLLHLMLVPGTKRLEKGAARILKRIQETQHSNIYESVFEIEYLTTEKAKLEEFERRKTYECYVKAEFKCEICYQGFKGEGYLDYHKKCHNEKQGQFACRICHVRQPSKRGHRKHMLLHQEVYKCKLCPLVTYYRYSMINHYEYHKGTIYKCDKCSNTYRSKSAFSFHQSNAHPRGAHVCSICGNGFVSQQGLHSHMIKKHRGESSASAIGSGFNCDECALNFTSDEACSRHRRIAHGARISQARRIPRQRKYSALAKPRRKPNMTCPECNAVGESYGWMVKHFNTEHPALDVATVYAKKKIHLCDMCGKGFANKYSLRDHMDFHSGVTFPCPTCTKQFSSQIKLSQHRLRHAPPGYCCERCGKKFHSYSNLYNHMRTHIGDRRFKCQICGKGFLHRCSLNAHIRGVHNQERRIRKKGVTDAHESTGDTGALRVTEMGDLGARARGTALNKEQK